MDSHTTSSPPKPMSSNQEPNSNTPAVTTDNTDLPDVTYRVGVAENTNSKYRRTMEDVHTYVKNFASRLDWGYFAIFDGHAGSQASKWCGSHLHSIVEEKLLEDETRDVRDILNESFLIVDKQINTKLQGSSECTAAVCILRWERPSQSPSPSRISNSNSNDVDDMKAKSSNNSGTIEVHDIKLTQHKRKLYTANVGDSRIVLFRDGRSIRLTYDHKSSDMLEMQRIEQAGGLIMKSRVNGMLAVTRSLGDKFFDNLVVGNPFNTSVEIIPGDKFLILACDGLWDVIDDQEACELISDTNDPDEAARLLVRLALERGTTDNVTVMVVLLS